MQIKTLCGKIYTGTNDDLLFTFCNSGQCCSTGGIQLTNGIQGSNGYAVDWKRKDLKIAMEEATKNNSPLPITKLIDEYYADVQKMGGQRWDTSSLIKRFRK